MFWGAFPEIRNVPATTMGSQFCRIWPDWTSERIKTPLPVRRPVPTPGQGRATPAMSGWTIFGTLGICP
jgi:hypothetical protein